MTGDDLAGKNPGLAEMPGSSDLLNSGSGTTPAVIRLDWHRRPNVTAEAPSSAERGNEDTIRVLVVEDEEEDFLLVHDLLARAENARFMVERAADAETGLTRLLSGQYDICLIDYRLPGQDGLGLARLAARRGIGVPLVLISSFATPGLDLEAIAAGAADFIDKEQFEVERLERTIRMALARERRQTLSSSAPLPVREIFHERLQHALARARRRNSLGAVLLIAADGLDDPAAEAAGPLPRSLREADTLLHLDGHLFGAILEDLTRPEHVALVARKLIERVQGKAGITANAGAALFPNDAGEGGALVAMAEAALARATAKGPGHCCHHDREIERNAEGTFELARELRRAIESDELALHFQPQVTLCSAELALATVARWRHPTVGMIEGERLRGLAEAGGLIESLDDWIMSAACRQARRWHEVGLQPLHVAVPLLSRRRLGWAGLATRLQEHLAAADLAPCWLELEINEHLLSEELASDGGALKALAKLGVRLAVDGYGAGPTSLALLRDAPLTTIKLARALLQGTPEDPTRTLFAAALIQLARQLGLRLVAEGIDSQTQLQLLRAQGCDAVQSLMSCPPLPADACTDWLRQASFRN